MPDFGVLKILLNLEKYLFISCGDLLMGRRLKTVRVTLPSVDPTTWGASERQTNSRPAGAVQLTEDIDAFITTLPPDVVAKMLLVPLTLNASKKRRKYATIKMKQASKIDGRVRLVSALPHARVGALLNTGIGPVDVYAVLPGCKGTADKVHEIVYTAVKDALADSIAHRPGAEYFVHDPRPDTITGVVETNNVSAFLNALGVRLKKYKPQIHLETFGNKASTIVAAARGSSEIDARLKTVFNLEHCPYALVDVCVGVSAGPGTMVQPKQSLFTAFELEPNFRPLGSRAVNNCNMPLFPDKAHHRRAIRLLHATKVNLYSSFCRVSNAKEATVYMAPLTMRTAQRYLMDCWVTGRKVGCEAVLDEYGDVKGRHALRGSNAYPYRIEVTTELSTMRDTLTVMKRVASQAEYFVVFDSDDVVEIVEQNIRSFVAEIRNPGCTGPFTFDDMLRASVAEIVMQAVYLKGCFDNSILANHVRHYVKDTFPISPDGIATIDDISGIVSELLDQMSVADRVDILFKVVTYDTVIDQNYKEAFIATVLLYYRQVEESPLLYILEVYANFMGREYENSFALLFADVGDDAPVEYGPKVLKKAFFTVSKCGVSPPGRLMLLGYASGVGISLEEALEHLIACARDASVVAWFVKRNTMTNKEPPPMCSLSWEPPVRGGGIRRRAVVDVRREEIRRLLALPLNRCPRVAGDIDEVVRYIHGMFRYRNSKNIFVDMLEDFVYGWWPVRNSAHLRSKNLYLFTYVKDMSVLYDMIEAARRWSPESFNASKRRQYMRHAGIHLTAELQARYDALVADATEHYYSTYDNSEFINASTEDVVQALFKNRVGCSGMVDGFIKWAEETHLSEESRRLFEIVDDRSSDDTDTVNVRRLSSAPPENVVGTATPVRVVINDNRPLGGARLVNNVGTGEQVCSDSCDESATDGASDANDDSTIAQENNYGFNDNDYGFNDNDNDYGFNDNDNDYGFNDNDNDYGFIDNEWSPDCAVVENHAGTAEQAGAVCIDDGCSQECASIGDAAGTTAGVNVCFDDNDYSPDSAPVEIHAGTLAQKKVISDDITFDSRAALEKSYGTVAPKTIDLNANNWSGCRVSSENSVSVTCARFKNRVSTVKQEKANSYGCWLPNGAAPEIHVGTGAPVGVGSYKDDFPFPCAAIDKSVGTVLQNSTILNEIAWVADRGVSENTVGTLAPGAGDLNAISVSCANKSTEDGSAQEAVGTSAQVDVLASAFGKKCAISKTCVGTSIQNALIVDESFASCVRANTRDNGTVAPIDDEKAPDNVSADVCSVPVSPRLDTPASLNTVPSSIAPNLVSESIPAGVNVPAVVPTQPQDASNNQDLSEIRARLFKKFGFSGFTPSGSRAACYNNRSRPSIGDWAALINRLVSAQMVERVTGEPSCNTYSMNPRNNAGRYISGRLVVQRLQDAMRKRQGEKLSRTKLRDTLSRHIRIDPSEWTEWLNYMVTSSVFVMEYSATHHTYLYSLAS